jgi:hypothetical protein
MERLPNELIAEVLQRGDLQEIRGLCDSNRFFREHCNAMSKSLIEKNFNYYELYLMLNRFHICINTNEGETAFTRTNDIKRIPNVFSNLMARRFSQRMQSDTDISWTIDDSRNPQMMNINFHYYSDTDCILNFDVVIQGNLKNYKTCEDLVEDMSNVFEKLN